MKTPDNKLYVYNSIVCRLFKFVKKKLEDNYLDKIEKDILL